VGMKGSGIIGSFSLACSWLLWVILPRTAISIYVDADLCPLLAVTFQFFFMDLKWLSLNLVVVHLYPRT